VARLYSGTAGKIENCQLAVHLVYAGRSGHALVDAALYLPKTWCEDRDRRAGAGIPGGVRFTTKPQLTARMIDTAVAAGLPCRWVTGDEAALATLISVAARRWKIEESFQTTKTCHGLDQHQVRRWRSWHRWTTLVICAHAFLAAATTTTQTTKTPARPDPVNPQRDTTPVPHPDHRTRSTPTRPAPMVDLAPPTPSPSPDPPLRQTSTHRAMIKTLSGDTPPPLIADGECHRNRLAPHPQRNQHRPHNRHADRRSHDPHHRSEQQ
jgi:hypothetical protein